MNETVKKLLDQIVLLPEPDRVCIADAIWETLAEDTQDELYADDPCNDPAYRKELERRIHDSAEHPENLIDGEKVFRELREKRKQRQTAETL